jgi:uncharacterized phage infection (PIP) family protein YhgE
MIRSLLKLGMLAVVCIVCYNYFFGDVKEKDQSKRIFKGVGAVFTEVRGLVHSEKDKLDAGKYDAALSKLQVAIQKLKSHADESNDQSLKFEVTKLEDLTGQVQQQYKDKEAEATENKRYKKSPDRLNDLNQTAKAIESLTDDLQSLVRQVESKNK